MLRAVLRDCCRQALLLRGGQLIEAGAAAGVQGRS